MQDEGPGDDETIGFYINAYNDFFADAIAQAQAGITLDGESVFAGIDGDLLEQQARRSELVTPSKVVVNPDGTSSVDVYENTIT